MDPTPVAAHSHGGPTAASPAVKWPLGIVMALLFVAIVAAVARWKGVVALAGLATALSIVWIFEETASQGAGAQVLRARWQDLASLLTVWEAELSRLARPAGRALGQPELASASQHQVGNLTADAGNLPPVVPLGRKPLVVRQPARRP